MISAKCDCFMRAFRRSALNRSAVSDFSHGLESIFSVPVWRLCHKTDSEPPEEVRQGRFQTLGDFFDIDQRDVPHAALDAAVICSVQPATLRSLFLIDFLLLADAADCAAKPDANIERHWL